MVLFLLYLPSQRKDSFTYSDVGVYKCIFVFVEFIYILFLALLLNMLSVLILGMRGCFAVHVALPNQLQSKLN